MPAISPAGHQARVGVFYNKINSNQEFAPNGRQFQGIRAVSNTALNRVPGIDAPGQNEVYRPLTIEMSSSDSEAPGSRVVTSGMGAAMKRHRVAGLLLAATALVAVTVVARQTLGSSNLAGQWLDDVPQPQPLPQPLIMSGSGSSANSATVVGICEQAINKFPRSNGAQVICPSMEQLQSIESDAKSILSTARSTVQDSAVGSGELREAARCAGVRLRKNRVRVLIAALRAEKSRLRDEARGTSVDQPIRVLGTQMQVAEIDRKLFVLTDTSRHLYDATVAINRRLLDIAG